MDQVGVLRQVLTVAADVLQAVPIGHVFVARHPALQDEVGPAGLPQGLQHQHRQPGAVLQTAAKPVGPAVGPGGQELVEQPAVAAVETHAVKARVLAELRRLHKVGAQLLHIRLGHGADGNAVLVDQVHGADGLLVPLDLALGLTYMAQLHQGQGPMAVNPLGELAVPAGVLLRIILKAVELIGPAAARGAHRGLPHKEGRLAAAGPQVYLRQLLRVRVVAVGVLVPDPAPGCAYHPVAVGMASHQKRGQQMRKFLTFHPIFLPYARKSPARDGSWMVAWPDSKVSPSMVSIHQASLT